MLGSPFMEELDMPTRKKFLENVSITEVANAAGVSIQTVSNVLNAPEKVTEKTRLKVMKVIEHLGYTPNSAARSLRSAKSSSIAVRIDSSASSGPLKGLYAGFIQDEFVFQLTKVSESRGIKVIPYTADSHESEIEKLRTLLKSKEVDGLILSSTIDIDPRLDFVTLHQIPFITFGRPWGAKNLYSTKHPWVDVDGSFGTSLATNMFLDKKITNIGFIGWVFPKHKDPDPQSVNEDRYLGWRNTIQSQIKLIKTSPLESRAVFGNESVEDGRRAMRELHKKFPEVQAVVCASDSLALGALLESKNIGIRELLVSGFDNNPVSQEFGFTSLDQNLRQVAKSSFEVLMGEEGNQIRRIDFANESTNAHVLLRPALIAR